MVKRLRITVVVDNEPGEGLLNEWGWSVYIESEKWTILFDADTSPRVLKYNFEKLKLDPKKITFAFLSHHHGDHSGGFEYIGREVPGLKVFVPPGVRNYLRDWGLDPVRVDGALVLVEDAWSTGPLWSIRGYSLYEHALAVKVDNVGLVVFVGCSHPGVDKLVEKAKKITGEEVYYVIGGYHKPSKRTLDNLAKLTKYMSPAHCSGDEAKNYVKNTYLEKYIPVKTGTVLEFGETT